jgi:integrase/recombinase XerC
VVYLSPQALAALNGWLAVRPDADDQAVFLSSRIQRISVRTIQERLAHYSRLAGVHVTGHQLRHTFGRHMVEAKVPVTSIQRLLGHARLRTTEIYLHVSDTRVQADYEAAIVLVENQLSSEGDER